ncbi:hypothetical protein MMC13_004703 [Lambiella insularis]|nr:hypothetical protein [Lambiella insularis]
MATRTTRGAAAKQAASVMTVETEATPQQLSSPPATPMAMRPKRGSRKPAFTAKGKQSQSMDVDEDAKNAGGSVEKSKTKPVAPKATATKTSKTTPSVKAKSADVKPNSVTGAIKKRKRTAKVKIEIDPNELPHGLGQMKTVPVVSKEEIEDDIFPPTKKVRADTVTVTKEDHDKIKSTLDTAVFASVMISEAFPKKKSPRTKKPNQYGVTLGVTPYPEWSRPTLEECQEVNNILSEKHGAVTAPTSIPLPSLTVAGCGEVPNILEALLRTVLSAHTSNGNAALAVQGLIKRFGVLKTGMNQGSIDWNNARLSGQVEIEKAITRGGLAKTKSKAIEGILKMVYEENEARRAALAVKASSDATDTKNPIDPSASTVDPNQEEAAAIERASEVMLADTSALTLDYIHAMSTENAFAKLITFPSIGVKTAACTLLFCMKRPSFAVDTHVYRLCKWLGWVPPNATRDTTFSHCDVRVPDKLKYSLHQLLIRHGKECGRCRAITGESSAGWDEGCVIDTLVQRTGKKKGGVDIVKKSKQKKATVGTDEETDEDATGEEQVSKSKPERSATPTKKKVSTGHAVEADIKEPKPKKRTSAATKGKSKATVEKVAGPANGKVTKVTRARKATKVVEKDTEEDGVGEEAEDDAEDDEDYAG